MRKYYIYKRPDLQFPGSMSSLPKELQRQVTRFRKKHYHINHFVIKRFLQEPILLAEDVFIYEENGICYEFFSKINVGEIIVDDVHGETYLTGKLPRSVYFGHDDAKYNYGYEVSVEKFSKEVSLYKRYCNELCEIMKSYLSLCSNLEHYYAKARAIENAEREARDKENIDWVETHIKQ